jgi:hypothetical protein
MRRMELKDELVHNTLRKKKKLLMSKAELARNAGTSPLPVDRIEEGMSCRIETKRKLVFAFGYELSVKGLIFTNN